MWGWRQERKEDGRWGDREMAMKVIKKLGLKV